MGAVAVAAAEALTLSLRLREAARPRAGRARGEGGREEAPVRRRVGVRATPAGDAGRDEAPHCAAAVNMAGGRAVMRVRQPHTAQQAASRENRNGAADCRLISQ